MRRAVNTALDERALRRVSGGLLAPTCNFLPPNIPGYQERDPPAPTASRAVSRTSMPARALVRKAGADGEEVGVWGPEQDPGPALTSYFADMLEEIGLEPKIQLIDFAVYSQVLGNAKTGAGTGFMSWAGEFPHPSSFLRQFTSSAITPTGNQNLGYVRDPTLDARFAELGMPET